MSAAARITDRAILKVATDLEIWASRHDVNVPRWIQERWFVALNRLIVGDNGSLVGSVAREFAPRWMVRGRR